MEYQVFPNILCLLHCVPLYVCRLCTNFQDLCARLLGMAAPFTSRFVIDFLSIRKVIIFSAIATDDRHPLRSRSIYQNAANCMMIRFRYIAQPRGVRKTYCARSRKWCSTPYQSVERYAEYEANGVVEDVRLCRNCSKVRPNVSR